MKPAVENSGVTPLMLRPHKALHEKYKMAGVNHSWKKFKARGAAWIVEMFNMSWLNADYVELGDFKIQFWYVKDLLL